MDLHQALEPPLDVARILDAVPEISLARGQGQGPYHHLSILEHTLEVIRGVERELEEDRLGARVPPGRIRGLRLVGLLHDVAKPITRGVYEEKVLFVAHDALGARLAHRVCRRLDVSAADTDLVTTLTALHLKIGFMGNARTDYPPQRLVRAAGPFGEELAILSWADRLAAQGPRLKQEHLDRHHELCTGFLRASRDQGPRETPDYKAFAGKLRLSSDADAGFVASRARLLDARSFSGEGALEHASLLYGSGSSGGEPSM